MTAREMQIEFERQVQVMDPSLAFEEKLDSDTIFSFLNKIVVVNSVLCDIGNNRILSFTSI